MAKLVVEVEGMSCEHCEKRVREAIESVEGVEKAVISLEAGTAEVTYDDGKKVQDAIAEAVDEAGYEVVV
ncbi:heavy-metal-associated domain-containing protein [Listeria cornellensis]|uniref:Copper chaperone CopZ n=1 Tax=Listeria cornellensis FSL F6-0969 TaxID=1265820 RepID=W7C1Q8_9LIST|nr:cation transporter [Listeria cornellensis]EUJ31155.1 heavy metal-binding protein [Listeria cornellensis FSL F6-0969]